MAFERSFDLNVDCAAGSVGTLLKDRISIQPAPAIVWIWGDRFWLHAYFNLRTGLISPPLSNTDLDAAAVLGLVGRNKEDLDSDALFNITEFTKVTVGAGDDEVIYYRGFLNLETPELAAVFATEARITVVVDLENLNAGLTENITLPQFEVEIRKQSRIGNEGTIGSGSPQFPPPSQVPRWMPALTSLTGGGATALDGQAGMPLNQLVITDTDKFRIHKLVSRSGDLAGQAEDSPNFIIPDDDATKIWTLKQTGI